MGGLVDEGEDGRLVGCGEGGVGGGAAGGEVVGVDDALVVLGQVVAEPVRAVVGGIAGEWRIAKWVLGRRLGTGGGVACLGVGVAERDQVFNSARGGSGGWRGGGRRRLCGRRWLGGCC